MTACANSAKTNPIVFSSETESSPSLIHCDAFMTATDYGVIFPIQSQAGGILKYYDFDSADSYPLCSNTNCSHADDSCNAWFDSMVFAPAICNDKIYLFLLNDDGNAWYFLSMDTDGSNRRTIAELDGDVFSCDDVFVSDVWYEGNTAILSVSCGFYENGDDFYALASLNLDDGQLKTLGTANGSDSIYAYENGIFFMSHGKQDEELLEEDEYFELYGTSADYADYYSDWYTAHYSTVYYLLDTNTGETTELLTVPGSEGSAEWDYDHLTNDGIFYGTNGNTLYGVNIASKTISTVFQSENELSIECAADGNVFFLQLKDNGDTFVANSYLNIETNEVTDLNGRIAGGGWIQSSTSKYFLGESSRGFFCITKENYYASNFKNISIIQKL